MYSIGYIGGSVLLRFLKHPNAASFNITVLVRSPQKAENFKAFGVKPVVGSHSDLELVEKLAAEADVVITAVGIYHFISGSKAAKPVFQKADADNLEAAQATLRGLKVRHKEIGSPPILIQTVCNAQICPAC